MQEILLATLLLMFHSTVAPQSTPQRTLRLNDLNGRTISVADYKGKVLLVNFWATWCIPCRTEIPDLVRLQRKYRSRGLRIVGVTYPPEELSDVRSFVRRLKMNYPITIGTKQTKSLFTASETLPMTVVIDAGGEVRNVIEGIIYPDEFDQKVLPLLSAKPAGTRSKARLSTSS